MTIPTIGTIKLFIVCLQCFNQTARNSNLWSGGVWRLPRSCWNCTWIVGIHQKNLEYEITCTRALEEAERVKAAKNQKLAVNDRQLH